MPVNRTPEAGNPLITGILSTVCEFYVQDTQPQDVIDSFSHERPIVNAFCLMDDHVAWS